jgi:ABC-type sugar transport system ATPase subunit
MSLADIIFIMKEGKIITSGPPQKLYEDPPDSFTAGFLGFPAMNLIEGTVADDHFLSVKGLKVRLRSYQMETADSQEVVLGIRPEDISISNSGGHTGEIVSLENHGRKVLLYIKAQGGDEIKVVGHGGFSVGDRLSFQLSPEKIILFDGKSRRRLVLGGA